MAFHGMILSWKVMKHDLFMKRSGYEKSCKPAVIASSWFHALMKYHEFQASMLYHEIHGISNAWKIMKIMKIYGLHELSWQVWHKAAGSKDEQGSLRSVCDCWGDTVAITEKHATTREVQHKRMEQLQEKSTSAACTKQHEQTHKSKQATARW